MSTSLPKNGGTGSTRRDLLVRGAALALPAVIIPARAFADQKLVFVSYGGTTQEAQEKTVIRAFQQETGIQVITASGPDVAKLKAQVRTGNIEWDVVNFIGSQAVSAAREGLLEKIDYSIVDASDMFLPTKEATLPWYSYGGGIGYDPNRHPAGKHPRDWPQFWDARSFPGRRGLRSRPDENLELALMADGVPAKSLYPLDVDRAFKSLDRIKSHVAKWMAETPQTISLLQANEVDFVFTYSGRVEAAKKQGLNLAYVYESNIVTPAYMCVAKGTRNRAASMKLVNYFLRPDLQAAFCNVMGYTPVKRAAMKLLTPEVRAQQPNLDDPTTAVTDVEWWADNFAEVNKRFKEWLIT
jgi:putative spermidine/putrescine transport system substrate-binding protein